jgi:hypothetical protein
MQLVARILRLEGFAIFAAAVWLYFTETDASWIWLAVLFLAPDLAFLAYPLGESATTRAYNLLHNYVAPVVLAVAGIAAGEELLVALALIWFGHIGIDRCVGYGLKYALAPGSTHIQRVAQPAPEGDPSAVADRASSPTHTVAHA